MRRRKMARRLTIWARWSVLRVEVEAAGTWHYDFESGLGLGIIHQRFWTCSIRMARTGKPQLSSPQLQALRDSRPAVPIVC
jgi:hypothetical protein